MWYTATDLANGFSILVRKGDETQFTSEWNEQYIFNFALGLLTILYSLIVQRELYWLDTPQNMTFIHYMDNILQIGQNKQEMVSVLEALVINRSILRRFSHCLFSEVQRSGVCTLSVQKYSCCIRRKPGRPWRVLQAPQFTPRNTYCSTLCWIIQKATSVAWGPKQYIALQQVQAVMQAALQLGPQDQQTCWYRKHLW